MTVVPQVRVRGRRSGKREPFWAGPVIDAITADIRPLPDELLEMKEAGELPEEADAPSQRELFAATVAPLLDRIPPKEADMIELYYFVGKSEADLGRIFEMTQVAVSYRLGKAMRRIKWLISVPTITEAEITTTLPRYGFAAWEVKFLAGMWRTTSVSEMSRQMMVSQAQGRRRFYSLAQRLKDVATLDDTVKPFADYFEAVRESPGILLDQGTVTKKARLSPESIRDRASPAGAARIEQVVPERR